MESALRKTLKNNMFIDVDEVVSARMKRIISSGTKPEVKLRKIIREVLPSKSKVLHNYDLPGKPDIYIPSYKIVIFLDGCFFHGCPKHGHVPKKNSEYWAKKFELNKRRDRRKSVKLRHMGFRVWRIWEHYLANERTCLQLQNILIKRFKKKSIQSNEAFGSY